LATSRLDRISQPQARRRRKAAGTGHHHANEDEGGEETGSRNAGYIISQIGALQVKVAAQSAGSAQVVLQAVVPSQAYFPQSVTAGTHWPPALQLNAVSVDAAQVVVAQVVPAG
jgi:hypothetical protein